MHWKYAGIKSRLLGQAPAVVLELGPGPGANLRYLPRGTKLIAVEPNLQMHPVLERRARQLGINLDLRGLAGESLDLPSASVDFVFSLLVLCCARWKSPNRSSPKCVAFRNRAAGSPASSM